MKAIAAQKWTLGLVRIVQVNAVYDNGIRTADALLDAYHTLTEWSAAMAKAGATVSVVQRFHTSGTIERDGISYEFVKDTEPPWLSTKAAPKPFVEAVARHSPDIVHVNGLIFPQLIAGIRATIGSAPRHRGATSRRRISHPRLRHRRRLPASAVAQRPGRG